jgi:integrase
VKRPVDETDVINKGKLTVKRVGKLLGKPGRYGDGGGLYMEVGDNSASWIFRWERDGRDHWHGLGSLRDVDLDEARELAREKRRLVKSGGNPIEEKRQAVAQRRLAAARTKTFGECATIYFNDRRDGWDPRHALQWSSTVCGVLLDGTPSVSDYCRPLRNVPVQLIDVPLVLSVIQPIWKSKPETAGRVLNRIGCVLDWARAAGLRSGDNPAAMGVIGKLLPKRERRKKSYSSVPVRDLPAVYAAIAARPGSPARALQFSILTATRTAETLDGQWSEIDFDDRVWVIPKERMKGGVEHRVPLSNAAIEMLRALPRDDHGLLFVSSRPGQALARSSLRKVLNNKVGRSETPHGMRATFSTWASDVAHAPPPVVEACLAHAIPNVVERSYKRGTLFDRRRNLMEQWSRFCTTPQPEENIDRDKVVTLGTIGGAR